jgi:lipopolysaccharide export system permease protein
LRTFALTLGVFVGLLLLQNVYDNLKDLIEFGAGAAGIANYYAVLLPSYLPLILPLVLMISILFSLGQLHRQSEIIAMRACGLSLWRITRSVWLFGLVLMAAQFSLNAKIVPWSVERSREIWDQYQYSKQLKSASADEVGVVRTMAYNNYGDGRLWMINSYSRLTGRARGVTVSLLDGSQRELTRILADEGRYDEAQGCWMLQRGRIITFDAGSGDMVRSMLFKEQTFKDFRETPEIMQLREKRARDLSINELRAIIATIPEHGDPDRPAYLTRYYSMALSPFICLIVVGIAIPFSVSGLRVNPMVGVSKAMGLFVGYYVVSSFATSLGTQGTLDPLAAAAIPPAFGVALAIYFSWRAA